MTAHAHPIYADTSFLTSCFVNDANSPKAGAILAQLDAPLMISYLVTLEFRTVLWRQAGRKELARQEAERALGLFSRQVNDGFLVVPDLAEADVRKKAAELSDTYAEALQLRSLDILHVALALVGGAKGFLTFDERQRSLAAAEDLKSNPT
jgi:predicted nucleic acid-binding protein